ncbi:hypothetical protein AGLY_003470 [Aphis glycines]|uniref:HAT C-terminal dimerisation domain-containing protein n=1 Tax=Aphis glycines TaxID=307491 RepID=A0A6G0U081_APHGL|nr:hypothetical protein AGLY_003470 [Aphis glycines]
MYCLSTCGADKRKAKQKEELKKCANDQRQKKLCFIPQTLDKTTFNTQACDRCLRKLKELVKSQLQLLKYYLRRATVPLESLANDRENYSEPSNTSSISEINFNESNDNNITRVAIRPGLAGTVPVLSMTSRCPDNVLRDSILSRNKTLINYTYDRKIKKEQEISKIIIMNKYTSRSELISNLYTTIIKADNDYDVYCTICSSSFSVSHGGRSDINDQLKTKKHRTCKQATNSSVRTFFTPLKTDENSLKLASKEVTFVNHTIVHSQSFNSMTCTSELIRKIFDEKKFTAARTKTRDIAVNVIAPYAVLLTKAELEKAKFVSILVDASNHKAIKLVPVIALINNFDLKNKIISFSADNTNTNFGGILRQDRNILGMGYFPHIIHNALQQAADSLPIDVESVVCKIYGYFHIYTVRVESLKEFCDFADSQNTCPTVLKYFFENETSLLWLKFVSCQFKTITSYIKKIESQNLSAIEIMMLVEHLLNIIKNKREEKFLTTEVENSLEEIEEEGHITKRDFDNKCDRFYEICYNNIYSWSESNNHNSELKDLLWVTLTPKTIVTWSNAKNSIRFLTKTCNTIFIDEYNFFNQFKMFEKYFKEQSEEWHNILSLEERWLSAFKYFKELNITIDCLLIVVEFSFSLPGSNAAVERVFSLMNSTWTKSRNKLDISTVEASLMIKTSFDNMSCCQFYESILSN